MLTDRLMTGMCALAAEPFAMTEAHPARAIRVIGAMAGMGWLLVLLPCLMLVATGGAIEQAWRGEQG